MRNRAIGWMSGLGPLVFMGAALMVTGSWGCATGNPGTGDELCGNLALDDGELCDDGNTTNGDGCSSTCQVEECGNGIIDVGEQCDDGNTADGDGCSGDCETENTDCGNGDIDVGEECDDGNTADGDGCSASCQIETPAVCGDGNVDTDEECDDGNTTDGDGCSATCTIEIPPGCGDGNLDTNEECDDGNNTSEDGCSAACVIESCGDGIRQAGLGEECDDGNTANEDGCNDTCLDEYCGDGTVQAGLSEQCDDGNSTSGDGCSDTCQNESTCGDGTRDSGEECDDGNTTSGDGCSDICQLDTLYLQPGPTDGKDAQVFSINPNDANPDATYSFAAAWTWSGTPGNRRSYFEFPLPAAMNGCTVSSATLYLYHNPVEPHEGLSGNTLETEISRVTQAWSETTITWNNQPSVDTSTTISVSPPTSSSSDMQLDLTAMVSHWFANPGSNHGFVFRLQTEVHYRRVVMTSSDYVDDPLRRPALAVGFSSCP